MQYSEEKISTAFVEEVVPRKREQPLRKPETI